MVQVQITKGVSKPQSHEGHATWRKPNAASCVCGLRTASESSWLGMGRRKRQESRFQKVRVQFPKAVFLKIQVFWGVVLCRPVGRHRRREIWFDSFRTQSGSGTSAEGVCDRGDRLALPNFDRPSVDRINP